MKNFKFICLLFLGGNLMAQSGGLMVASDESTKCSYFEKSRMAILLGGGQDVEGYFATVVPNKNLFELFSILPDSIEKFALRFDLDSSSNAVGVLWFEKLSNEGRNYEFISYSDKRYCDSLISLYLKNIDFCLSLDKENKNQLYKRNRYDRMWNVYFYRNEFYLKPKIQKYDYYVAIHFSVTTRKNKIVDTVDIVGKRNSELRKVRQERLEASIKSGKHTAFNYLKQSVECETKRGKRKR